MALSRAICAAEILLCPPFPFRVCRWVVHHLPKWIIFPEPRGHSYTSLCFGHPPPPPPPEPPEPPLEKAEPLEAEQPLLPPSVSGLTGDPVVFPGVGVAAEPLAIEAEPPPEAMKANRSGTQVRGTIVDSSHPRVKLAGCSFVNR